MALCPRCRPLVLVLFACNGLLDPAAAAAGGGGYGGLAGSLPPVPGAGAPAVAALLTRRGLNADLFDLSIAHATHSAGRSDSAAASFAITNAAGGRADPDTRSAGRPRRGRGVASCRRRVTHAA